MTENLLVAGDFSGIQRYVLNVSASGGGQARRLRARSFFVELAGEVTIWKLLQACDCGGDAVLTSGGGQFLLRVPAKPGKEERLLRIREELETRLFSETRGDLGLSLAWGSSVEDALLGKEIEKRRLWSRTMTSPVGWNLSQLSLEELADVCEICRRQSAALTRDDDGQTVRVCRRCHDDTEIGRRLPQIETVSLDERGGGIVILGASIRLQSSKDRSSGGTSISRPISRHIPLNSSGQPLTFEEIAGKAKGDNLLAVLKADVDDMGLKIGETARQDATLASLKRLSLDLDKFFSRDVQKELTKPPWNSIYTVYSGGDDLLLVGPWDIVLDFSGVVTQAFQEGPGKIYGLTLSAGIALTPYGLPMRHGVDWAEAQLKQSKQQPKNQCSALGGTWDWGRHRQILEQAKQAVRWIESGICGRALIHRLLTLSQSSNPKMAALWAYEVGRNFPSRNDSNPERRQLRAWGEEVLAGLHNGQSAAMQEICVELRYALTATRSRRA